MTSQNTFHPSMIADPTIFKVNTLPAHSDHTVFRSAEELERGESSLRFSLNGLWKFHYAKNYASRVAGFETDPASTDGWDDIRVPSNMQMEGWDAPAYVNVQYPWDGREAIESGQIPEHFNPVGQYVTCFSLPKDWTDLPVRISFQGAESGFALWLNGSFIGYSEDSFTPSEFDLTPFLAEGENRLAVEVYKWTSGSWTEDQDFFRFSGIFRDVYLQAVPRWYVEDVKILSDLDETFENGLLEVQLKLSSDAFQDASGAGTLRWRLEDLGCAVPGLNEEPVFSRKEQVLAGEERLQEVTRFSAQPKQVHPWSAESPWLYALTCTILDETEQVQGVVRELVGFRHFAMQDGIMCLNGKRIVFNGVNRHEFSARNGRSVQPQEVVRDLTLMKRFNINAVRTCHYPNASLLYHYCDLFGLYLIAENNMETHGSWDAIARGNLPIEAAIPGDRSEYREAMLDRVRSTCERDKNHPAILIWSCGNESFGGSVIHEMAQTFRALDPTRLVHYEGIMHDRRYPDTSDMESQMYTSAQGVEQFLREHPEKPLILCEYTHSMGNSNGGMHKYIELSERNPRYQGGFIWDFVDQAVAKKNRYGEPFFAYGGDSGERPTDYEFSGNGIVDAGRRPYEGKVQEVKYNYRGIQTFVQGDSVRIVNKYLFTATDAFSCVVLLEQQGRGLEKQPLKTAVAPLSEETFLLPERIRDAMALLDGEYTVTVSFRLKQDTLWAGHGYEIAFGQGVYGSDKALPSDLEAVPADLEHAAGLTGAVNGIVIAPLAQKPALEVIRGTVNLGVRGAHFEVLFGGLKGGLVSYRWGGRELIDQIPRPNFWRAPVNNDDGNHMGARQGLWKLAGSYQEYYDPERNPYEADPDPEGPFPKINQTDAYVEIIWKKYLLRGLTALTTYRVFADGTVRLILQSDVPKDLPDLPEFGYLFAFPADLDQVTYYGLGPEENYCDRREGARLGVYQTNTKEMAGHYLTPQEAGNRTGVRWAKLTDARGRGLVLRAAGFPDSDDPAASLPGTMEFSALPYSPDMLESAKHAYELPPVHHTFVKCSLKQMGVAGDDSWGAPVLEEYRIPSGRRYTFAVDLRGI